MDSKKGKEHMKYIETDKLIAEIERWRDKAKETYKYTESIYTMGRYDALAEFRNHIVSLQEEQPEIDLEKEIIRYQREDMDRDTTVGDVARHFYELGLNARKEE